MRDKFNLVDGIIKLKKDRNAIILVHNYQNEEVQQVADFLGDSLDLSRKARDVTEDVIVFCGVNFMAETAKILSPDKVVLLPAKDARCPMADMVTADDVRKQKAFYPKATVVCYVNTTAEVKAECDVCCTSAIAVKVVENVPSDTILFFPDRNLAGYVQRFTQKRVIPWPGYCYVHRKFKADEITAAHSTCHGATIVVHPECDPEVIDLADEVRSTGGLVKLAEESEKDRIVVGTEEGMIKRLQREYPEKEFYSLGPARVCVNMKKIRLEDVYQSLLNMQYQVKLPEDTMNRARTSLEKMVQLV